MRKWVALCLSLFLSALFVSHVAHAQWQPNGLEVSPAVDYPENLAITMAPDGAGGTFVAWVNYTNSLADTYMQHYDAYGVALWPQEGILVFNDPGHTPRPLVVADGVGGAIVALGYTSFSTGNHLIAQRLNANGVPQWAPFVEVASYWYADAPYMISDGAGGAIIAWSDTRTTWQNIRAQRLNAAGEPVWDFFDVLVAPQDEFQTRPVMVADGSGGVVIAFENAFLDGSDVYAQRLDSAGLPLWDPAGVAVSTRNGAQDQIALVPDGTGGAIVCYKDGEFGAGDMRAQRLDASGVGQWFNAYTIDGKVPLAWNAESGPVMVSDGVGGAIVAWAGSGDIFGQHLTAAGSLLWGVDGTAVCAFAQNQKEPTIASDGAGGAIVTWADNRGGNYDIYAQRINGAAVKQWAANGALLATAPNEQQVPRSSADGANGVTVLWLDYRNFTSSYYVHRMQIEDGAPGHPDPFVTHVADVPGDQGGKVKVNWKASDRDDRLDNAITHYSIWRAVDAVTVSQSQLAGAANLITDLADVGAGFEGHYRMEPQASGTPRYWEWVGNQPALFSSGYSFSASTRSDSTMENNAVTFFQVAAHTASQFVLWTSNALGGRSVDNLAPPAPLYLTAQRAGADVKLKWNRSRVADLRDYSVYRGTSTGVTPIPTYFLDETDDSVLVDASAPNTTLYYIVTARDVHANQSEASNEAMVSPSTGAGPTPALRELTVLQNRPNPFAGSTELEIGLPAAADVSVDVYDVAGRRVRSQVLAQRSTGWHRLTFDGRDDAGRALASGVYFARITAGGATVTRKMVIAR